MIACALRWVLWNQNVSRSSSPENKTFAILPVGSWGPVSSVTDFSVVALFLTYRAYWHSLLLRASKAWGLLVFYRVLQLASSRGLLLLPVWAYEFKNIFSIFFVRRRIDWYPSNWKPTFCFLMGKYNKNLCWRKCCYRYSSTLNYRPYPAISVSEESKASFKLLNIGTLYFTQNPILFFLSYFNKKKQE